MLSIKLNTRNLIKIAMLAATAFVLMLISFPLAAFFPSFLELDISDVPALVGGFALGPIAGVLIELLKNILKVLIKPSPTGGVGELSNFLVGSFFVVPASVIYMIRKSKKNAMLGLLAGSIFMTVSACFSNYFIIIPLYQQFMPLEQIIALSPLKIVKDMKSFILYAIVPFNLIKSIVVSTVTLLIYKKLSPLLHS
ncbi:MAG TPA: ECF transporter S component [Clostridiales bacterium]|nr:ECF transporter S component [Clostridiales bacterium]